ncbi:LOW QUALITY PROTEIN: hypothetical protein U9M48_013013 [Paspalum notatum var. saurae]|uniref:Retrotransposon gag domain-containing protein n=1 Tax=Paspalum notatum var. saurae TaxID=547442 RepID=A0AAQ3SZ51_PASNO
MRPPLLVKLGVRARATTLRPPRTPGPPPPHSSLHRAPVALDLVAVPPSTAEIPLGATSSPRQHHHRPPPVHRVARLVHATSAVEIYLRVSAALRGTSCAPRRGSGEPKLTGARARREEDEGDPASELPAQEQPLIEEPDDQEQEPPQQEENPALSASSRRLTLAKKGLRPPVFTTCPEPLAADDWPRTIESKFTLLPGITEQEKARFAAQLLQGPAAAWYAMFRNMQQGHVITYGELSAAFRAHYISASLMERKQHEVSRTQGNRTVMQYVQTFIHLSQYAPGDVADEPSRAARLLQGFDPTIQTHLRRRY